VAPCPAKWRFGQRLHRVQPWSAAKELAWHGSHEPGDFEDGTFPAEQLEQSLDPPWETLPSAQAMQATCPLPAAKALGGHGAQADPAAWAK